MKGKKLKLWQMLILVFSTVILATGGSLLYVYLDGGFGSEIIEPENVYFVDTQGFYNADKGQLEVGSDFSLVINSDTEKITEKKVTLSFGKTLSTQTITNTEFVDVDGIKYISNGVIRVPEVVEFGKAFTVNVEQKTYSYNSFTYQGNVGGISTLIAKGTKAMGEVVDQINIAVDVAVEKVDLITKNTFTQEEKQIQDGKMVVLQNTNFVINPKFYPAQSEYRYSDELYNSFYGQELQARKKSYCFESSDKNVVMNYSEDGITFSSNYIISSGNGVNFYVFKNAAEEERFLKENPNLAGQVLYNTMLKALSTPGQSSVIPYSIDFSVEQAKVSAFRVENKNFSMYVNKKFRLYANNNDYHANSLKIAISDEKGEDLKDLIKEVALQVFYTKAGGVKTEVVDDSILKIVGGGIKEIYSKTTDKSITVGKAYFELVNNKYVQVAEPIVEKIAEYYERHVYYLVNSNVSNVNDAYWDLSSSFSDTVTIEANVVLFETKKNETGEYETKVFDEKNQQERIINLSLSEHQEENISWQGEKEVKKTIVYNYGVQIPAEVDLTTKIGIPTNNVYQTAFYYVYKDEISANDVNINIANTYDDGDGKIYYQANGSNLMFKTAGTYSVIFVTVKTDAYGNLIDSERNIITTDYSKIQIVKVSEVLSVNISETLQEFESSISIDKSYAVYALTTDTSRLPGKIYYSYEIESDSYIENGEGENPYAAGLFEHKYYAVDTKSGVITLKIEVKEKDTTKFVEALTNGQSDNVDTSKDSLKFYVVSADGSIKKKVTSEVLSQNGKNCDISLKIPQEQIESIDGKGKAFYVQVIHNNTLIDIPYDIQVTDFYESVGFYNCFRIYTPSPETISNEVLFGKTFTANISMDEKGQYSDTSINDEAGKPISKADFYKLYTEAVIVRDAYGRKYDGARNISLEENKDNVVAVSDGRIQFLSNAGTATVVVSAGLKANGKDQCSAKFMLSVNAFGIAAVVVDEDSYTDPQAIQNISYEMTGSSSDNTIDLSSLISVQVGKDKTDLTAKYFYINVGHDSDLLKMIKVGDEYATEINSDEPISSFTIAHDFFTEGKFTIIVSNSDKSAVKPATETVRFAVTFVIGQAFDVTERNTEKELSEAKLLTETENIVDGLYAGYSYSLNDVLELRKRNVGDPLLDWDESSYKNGDVFYDTNKNKVAQFKDGGYIEFYDVDSIKKDVKIDISYYISDNKSNRYSYTSTLTVDIYPNVEMVATKEINLLTLSMNASHANYIGVTRIRGDGDVSNFVCKVENENSNLQIDEEGNFGLSNAINFAYNKYIGNLTIGLYLETEEGKVKVLKKVLNLDGTAKTAELTYSIEFVQENLNALFLDDEGELPSEVRFVAVEDASVKAITVLSENADRTYFPDTTEKELIEGGASYKYKFVVQPASAYADRNGGIQFRAGTTSAGYRFANNLYVHLQIIGIGESSIHIATAYIPVYISNVGLHFANYSDYNIELRKDFNIATLLNGNEEGLPQASMKAGESVRLTYKQDEANITDRYSGVYMKNVGTISQSQFANGEYYTADISGNYYFTKATTYIPGTTYYTKAPEGIYYDRDASVEVTFLNESLSSEYGVIYEKEGEWYIQFNNLANVSQNITLKVKINQAAQFIDYTYRIKVNPNIYSNITYPFASSENWETGAEFIDVTGNDEYDLNAMFGTYAGAKHDKYRFNLYLDESKTIAISQDTVYYVEADKLEGNIVSKGASLYLLSGEDLISAGTVLPSDLKVESSEIVIIKEGEYAKIKIASSAYSIQAIKVKSNSEQESSVLKFDELEADKEYIYQVMSGVVYKIKAQTNADGREFTIYNNAILIGNVKLSSEGILTLTNMNPDYFVGLVIKKSYSNIEKADLMYNMNINNTQGTFYVEYVSSTFNTTDQVLTEVEGLFTNEIAMNVKFDGGGSSRDVEDSEIAFDIENLNYILKNRKGEVVGDPSTVIEDISLEEIDDELAKYTLRITKADVIDQDYKFVIYFANDSQTISTLTLNIPCSLKVEAIEGATVLGGTTIDAASLFTFSIDGEPQTPKAVNILNIDEIDFISEDNKVAALNENKTEVLDLSFEVDDVTYYVDGLEVNFTKNITTSVSTEKIEDYIAGNTGSIGISQLYQLEGGSSLQDGSVLELESVVLTDGNTNYFVSDSAHFSLSGSELCFKSLNVGQIVEARFNAVMSYTFKEYTFTWTTMIPVTIHPNAEFTVNYPRPENDTDSISSESIKEGIYDNFFGSQAYLGAEDTQRIEIASTSGKTVQRENAIIRIKNLQNVKVYNYPVVEIEEQVNAGKYYVYDEERKEYVLAFPIVPTTTYYVLNQSGTYDVVTIKTQQDMGKYFINIGTLAEPEYVEACDLSTYVKYFTQIEASSAANTHYSYFQITDLTNELVFKLAESYEYGTVTFEIEYNAVKTTYNVDVFKNSFIDYDIVKTVNNEGNKEVIFYEQLSDGKAFQENAVARIDMDPSVPSGTYYIKVTNTGSYTGLSYIGFEYDSQASKTIYVFLGKTFSEEDIQGIFANKTNTANDLRDIGSTTLSLTKFISLYYKVLEDSGEISYKLLKNDSAQVYEGSNSLGIDTIFLVGDSYYELTANGEYKYIGTKEEFEGLEPYVYGNYYAYDTQISDSILVSTFDDVEATEDIKVEAIEGTSDFYKVSDAEGEITYVDSTAVSFGYSAGTQAYEVEEYTDEIGLSTGSGTHRAIGVEQINDEWYKFNYEYYTYYAKYAGSTIWLDVIKGKRRTNIPNVALQLRGTEWNRIYITTAEDYYLYIKGELPTNLNSYRVKDGDMLFYNDGNFTPLGVPYKYKESGNVSYGDRLKRDSTIGSATYNTFIKDSSSDIETAYYVISDPLPKNNIAYAKPSYRVSMREDLSKVDKTLEEYSTNNLVMKETLSSGHNFRELNNGWVSFDHTETLSGSGALDYTYYAKKEYLWLSVVEGKKVSASTRLGIIGDSEAGYNTYELTPYYTYGSIYTIKVKIGSIINGTYYVVVADKNFTTDNPSTAYTIQPNDMIFEKDVELTADEISTNGFSVGNTIKLGLSYGNGLYSIDKSPYYIKHATINSNIKAYAEYTIQKDDKFYTTNFFHCSSVGYKFLGTTNDVKFGDKLKYDSEDKQFVLNENEDYKKSNYVLSAPNYDHQTSRMKPEFRVKKTTYDSATANRPNFIVETGKTDTDLVKYLNTQPTKVSMNGKTWLSFEHGGYTYYSPYIGTRIWLSAVKGKKTTSANGKIVDLTNHYDNIYKFTSESKNYYIMFNPDSIPASLSDYEIQSSDMVFESEGFAYEGVYYKYKASGNVTYGQRIKFDRDTSSITKDTYVEDNSSTNVIAYYVRKTPTTSNNIYLTIPTLKIKNVVYKNVDDGFDIVKNQNSGKIVVTDGTKYYLINSGATKENYYITKNTIFTTYKPEKVKVERINSGINFEEISAGEKQYYVVDNQGYKENLGIHSKQEGDKWYSFEKDGNTYHEQYTNSIVWLGVVKGKPASLPKGTEVTLSKYYGNIHQFTLGFIDYLIMFKESKFDASSAAGATLSYEIGSDPSERIFEQGEDKFASLGGVGTTFTKVQKLHYNIENSGKKIYKVRGNYGQIFWIIVNDKNDNTADNSIYSLKAGDKIYSDSDFAYASGVHYKYVDKEKDVSYGDKVLQDMNVDSVTYGTFIKDSRTSGDFGYYVVTAPSKVTSINVQSTAFGSGKEKYYVDADDVRTVIGNGKIYYKGQTLDKVNIIDVNELELDKTNTIRFAYGVGGAIIPFDFTYSIDIDLDVRNSIESETPTSAVTNAGTQFAGDGYKFNYLELEARKTYNFNDLIGVVKASSGNTLAVEDIPSDAVIALDVLTAAEAKNLDEIQLLTATGRYAGLAESFIDIDDIKGNDDVIRLSYELLKTNDSSNGVVYDFKLMPLGADNDGDYVVVKYTYGKNVDGEVMNHYYKYILVKIMPDYVVEMADASGNAVKMTEEANLISNKDNVIEIVDFEAIGDMIATGNTTGSDDAKVKYGRGKATVNSSGQDAYTKIEYGEEGNLSGFVDTNVISPDGNEIETGSIIYENVEIVVTTNKNIKSFVKVRAGNAIDSARDIATAFTTTGVSSDAYLENKSSSTGHMYNIKEDITLGERSYTVTLEDSYGYTIKVHFKLKASTNPTVSSSSDTRFTEGESFDIGAKFEVIDVTEFTILNSFYYDTGTTNSDYVSFTPKNDEATTNRDSLYIKLLNGTYVKLSLIDEGYITSTSGTAFDISKYNVSKVITVSTPTGVPSTKYFEKTSEGKYIPSTHTSVQSGTTYYLISQCTLPKYEVKDISVGESIEEDQDLYEFNGSGYTYTKTSDTKAVEGKTYYEYKGDGSAIATLTSGGGSYTLVQGENDAAYDEPVQSVYTSGSGENILIYGYGKTSEDQSEFGSQTAIVFKNNKIVVVDNTMLVPNAEMLSKTLVTPVKNTKKEYAPDKLIILEGFNAFGYANKNMVVAGDNPYFTDETDLDKIGIDQIEYSYTDSNGNRKVLLREYLLFCDLASSSSYYKYGSDDPMGRDTSNDNMEIPVLPGWVYGANDYAEIEMSITFESEDGDTYTLSIPIIVDKHKDRILQKEATNVSDNTEFNLSDHIKKTSSEGENFEYFDDTLAVTLPSNYGTLTVDVEASYGRNTYTGSQTIASIYESMDSTYYLGLSQIVGHTLDPNYEITVTFSGYDTNKVTRSGNFGFYCSYKGAYFASGNYHNGTSRAVISEGVFVGIPDNPSRMVEHEGKYIPYDNIGSDGRLLRETYYVTELKDAEHADEIVKSFRLAEISSDKLHIADMGELSNGKKLVTKYYIGMYTDGKYYQVVKKYNLYPTYFNFKTADFNHMVEAELKHTCVGPTCTCETFEFYSWANEVKVDYYGASNAITSGKALNASGIDLSSLYFELGDKDNSSASIDRETGLITIDRSKFVLDGTNFITVNIYTKASGEEGSYIDNNLPYSGNGYNKAMITVYVYLKDTRI